MVKSTSIILSPGDNLITSKYLPQLKKTFPQPYQSSKDKLGLLCLNMYYSWFNVTTTFNNTSCSYMWSDGLEYQVNYPDGFYLTSDLNNYLQLTMYNNGHYLLNDQNLPIYFLTFISNPVFYAITLTSTPLPLSLPQNWVNPANVALNGVAPQLKIFGSNSYGALLGFPAGLYPSVQSNSLTQINSSLPPVASPVTSINMLCTWCSDSRFTSRPSVIATFTPNVKFGSLFTFNPPVIVTFDVIPKQYTNIDISFVDQNFVPLQITDLSQIQVNILLQTDDDD